jgi:hypothetical protein
MSPDYNAVERGRWGGPSPWAGRDSRTAVQRQDDEQGLSGTEYTATWRWIDSGQDATLTYSEHGLATGIRAMRRALAEGRITRAQITARTVVFDSAAGIDLCPEDAGQAAAATAEQEES